MNTVPRVLLVCADDTDRCQITAALLAERAAPPIDLLLSGCIPGVQVNDTVRLVLAEIGVDLTRVEPRPLVDGPVAVADAVITLGGDAAHLTDVDIRHLDWGPAVPTSTVEEIRSLRDDIDERVDALLTELRSAPRRSRWRLQRPSPLPAYGHRERDQRGGKQADPRQHPEHDRVAAE